MGWRLDLNIPCISLFLSSSPLFLLFVFTDLRRRKKGPQWASWWVHIHLCTHTTMRVAQIQWKGPNQQQTDSVFGVYPKSDSSYSTVPQSCIVVQQLAELKKMHWLTYSCIKMHIGTGVDFESITHGVLLWLVLQMCITSGLQKSFLTNALEGIKSY